ncbi:MAG: hypothetical protein QW179_00490 [Candidatus Hadarchaeales archaeon]
MKVGIFALGLHPRPIELLLEKRKFDICHLIASKDGLGYVAKEHGYSIPNSQVVKKAAAKGRSKLKIYECDPFDPESISDALGQILEQLKMNDEVTINYSSGTQVMSLILGSVAIVLSRIMPVKIIYSTKAVSGKEEILDHTEALKDFFSRLQEIVPAISI